jgi:hypothetical protein
MLQLAQLSREELVTKALWQSQLAINKVQATVLAKAKTL